MIIRKTLKETMQLANIKLTFILGNLLKATYYLAAT